MKVLRKYLECDMLMGFDVHTEDTLDRLDNLIMELGDLIQVRVHKCSGVYFNNLSIGISCACTETFCETKG